LWQIAQFLRQLPTSPNARLEPVLAHHAGAVRLYANRAAHKTASIAIHDRGQLARAELWTAYFYLSLKINVTRTRKMHKYHFHKQI
jgi:hypothetical protein